jgi:hypothetical protein
MDTDDLPDVILDPPERFDLITNRIGRCGVKPNLVYGGNIHRMWVTHAVDIVREQFYGDVDAYVNAFAPNHCSREVKEEMRETVQQALEFHDEYEMEFEMLREYREQEWQRIREKGDDGGSDAVQ